MTSPPASPSDSGHAPENVQSVSQSRSTASGWSTSTTLERETPTTTSQSGEQLLQAELKTAELEGVAERLKRDAREGRARRASGLNPAEARRRVQELKRDGRAAWAEAPRRSTAGLFKAACSTDLLFLIDTTASMTGYINAAKEQVISIVNDIKGTFHNEAEVRLAVVGYKDHGDPNALEFLDFTPSATRVRSFVNGLKASGGGDVPENVLGAIQQALNATWKQQTRCIVHITDAPPHGSKLHDLNEAEDTYYNLGSEPHGLSHEVLFPQLVSLKINYALLRINRSTDKMAYTLYQQYAAGSGDCSLNTKNRYYAEAHNMNKYRSNSVNPSGGVAFEETELGTTFSALQHLVVKMVTGSSSRTAVRMSASRTSKGTSKKSDGKLAAISEDEDDIEPATPVQLETSPPLWGTPLWLKETLVVEGFSPDIIVHNAHTLNSMMENDDNIRMNVTELTIKKRPLPFAQGAMRVASYAGTAASTDRFVVKSFKREGKRLAHLAEDMRGQALCKAFALEFNALLGEEHALDFIVTTCLKGSPGEGSSDECMSLEPYIEGKYVKYNNNCGYINKDNPDNPIHQAAQAFSHFTFERSQGQFLVSDLQGVGNVLTDPAIHTLDPERFNLADTNLGPEGFKFFFATHVCNDICTKLGLKSNASMIRSGRYQFRKKWPSMDKTVCCCNKLCGRIVRLASAKKSDQFPGYHWCDTCWPQLQSTMVEWVCDAPGPVHTFKISRFFYESQGRTPPRMCTEHRGEEMLSVPAILSGNLWSRLRSAEHRDSEEEYINIVRPGNGTRKGFWGKLVGVGKKAVCLGP